MAAPVYLTKGELRAKLLIRLGYGGLGASAGMFVPIADDLLEEGQQQLFEIFTDEKRVTEWPFTTGVNQRWYDIPDTCDIDHINDLWSQQNGDSWYRMKKGIDAYHDADYDDIADYPYRYDIKYNPATSKTQIEVWPKPDDNYAMKIEGTKILLPFVADADRASVDDRLILLYAIAYGKAHLNRPDARSAMDAWSLRLKAIKANQHGTTRYVRRNPNTTERAIRSRPKVV